MYLTNKPFPHSNKQWGPVEAKGGQNYNKKMSIPTSLWCYCPYALKWIAGKVYLAYMFFHLSWSVRYTRRFLSVYLWDPRILNMRHFFSSFCSRAIAVRTGPTSGVRILVRRPQVPHGVAPELLGSMNWESLGGDFIEVHWSKMPGRTFVQKLFLLLAIEMYWSHLWGISHLYVG